MPLMEEQIPSHNYFLEEKQNKIGAIWTSLMRNYGVEYASLIICGLRDHFCFKSNE